MFGETGFGMFLVDCARVSSQRNRHRQARKRNNLAQMLGIQPCRQLYPFAPVPYRNGIIVGFPPLVGIAVRQNYFCIRVCRQQLLPK
jgi:hypothetical protein